MSNFRLQAFAELCRNGKVWVPKTAEAKGRIW